MKWKEYIEITKLHVNKKTLEYVLVSNFQINLSKFFLRWVSEWSVKCVQKNESFGVDKNQRSVGFFFT